MIPNTPRKPSPLTLNGKQQNRGIYFVLKSLLFPFSRFFFHSFITFFRCTLYTHHRANFEEVCCGGAYRGAEPTPWKKKSKIWPFIHCFLNLSKINFPPSPPLFEQNTEGFLIFKIIFSWDGSWRHLSKILVTNNFMVNNLKLMFLFWDNTVDKFGYQNKIIFKYFFNTFVSTIQCDPITLKNVVKLDHVLVY